MEGQTGNSEREDRPANHLEAAHEYILRLPAFRPWPAEVRPDADEISAASYQWCVAHGLMSEQAALRHFDSLGYARMAAAYAPICAREIAQLISDFFCWYFVFDDQQDWCVRTRNVAAWRHLHASVLDAIDHPSARLGDSHPIVRALADVLLRYHQLMSQAFADRFSTHVYESLASYDTEVRHRLCGTLISLDEYLVLRRRTFGHYVWTDHFELCTGQELPFSIVACDPFQRAAMSTHDVGALMCDLYSMVKEEIAGDIHNAGLIISRQSGCSLPEAADTVRGMINQRLEDFCSADNKTRQLGTAPGADLRIAHALEIALANMRASIACLADFADRSIRYSRACADTSSAPFIEKITAGPR